MKKILLTLAAIPAATLAVEASAQTGYNAYGAAYGDVGIQNRIAQLEMRLNTGIQQGAISRSEHRVISRQLNQLRMLERQYSANGLTEGERRTLRQRIRTARNQLRSAYGNAYAWNDNDWDNYNVNYGANYGANNGANYGAGVRYDQYGRVIPNTGVVYDQYGRPVANSGVVYDQYGRPVANGYYGQGGPYEAPRSNGIGSILSGVLGSVVGGGSGILGNGGLGVGSVITSTIANALGRGSSYGNQYYDRGNVYFRSDGQRVYEIDARTNQVIRIHPVR